MEAQMERHRANLLVCGGTGCTAGGGKKIKDALEAELTKNGLTKEYKVVATGCNGFCVEGPIMNVYPEGVFYEKLKPDAVPQIVEEHLLKGRPVDKFLYKRTPLKKDIPFFKDQVFRVLKNKDLMDPENIEEYIALEGYQAAAKALHEMAPEEIVKTVKDSGIRGRGGAGFPTGLKWELCASTPSDERFILCNGDEGDPGVFVDRSIMEGNPHAVLEGMIIAARAIGARRGYIYVRVEYFLAVERLQKAIEQAREYGLLGEDILGSGFALDIEVFPAPGAFVCGESTALMMTIEGKRGMPRPTPPNSVYEGLWGKPTVLNNVQTLAYVPQIVMNGAEWFRQYGTEQSAGTRAFILTGSINNVGVVEAPIGLSLRDMVFGLGGGVKRGREFKAVQIGGPSGCHLPESFLDTPVTHEDMDKTGGMLGSGGIVVMDDMNCMVSAAKFMIEFTNEESCGKCPPCRIGTKVMLDILTEIAEGRGGSEDPELLLDLSRDVMNVSLCGLGRTAPKPLITAIEYFREEFREHIEEGWCRAGVCKDLVTFFIDEESCKGCGMCLRACPVNAITGEKKKPHSIDQELCIKCRSCLGTCKFKSIRTGPASLREELLKQQPVEA
jgi:NADH:ubiquinone oxidoreductase subunit F (NADH-binding)/ferredoxin